MAGENAEKFGFVFVPFFKNVSMYNCTRMEWKLQAKYDYLPCTGRRRLWKKTGSGLEYLDKYGKCMVYISLSFKVQGMLDSGKLIRGTPSLTIDNDRREKIGLYPKCRCCCCCCCLFAAGGFLFFPSFWPPTRSELALWSKTQCFLPKEAEIVLFICLLFA